MRFNQFQFIGLLILSSFVGCADKDLVLVPLSTPSEISNGGDKNNPTNTQDLDPANQGARIPPGPEGSLFTRVEYVQPANGSTYNKIDILFVIDTSGSLNDERAAIAAGLNNFIDALPTGSDFQIGVSLAHMNSSRAGMLYRSGTQNGEPVVLRSSQMSQSAILEGFQRKMSNPPDDEDADGGEGMLYSLYRMFTNYQTCSSGSNDGFQCARLNGFPRTDAALAVIIVTDEDDICDRVWNPNRPNRVADGETTNGVENEEIAANRYCRNSSGQALFTPQSLYRNVLKPFVGSRPLILSSLAHSGENPIPNLGENSLAYGVIDLVAEATGVQVDLADPLPDSNANAPDPQRIANGMSFIGDYVFDSISNLRRLFALQRWAVTHTIQVWVDDASVNFDFDVPTHVLTVSNPGRAGSHVIIEYYRYANSDGTP